MNLAPTLVREATYVAHRMDINSGSDYLGAAGQTLVLIAVLVLLIEATEPGAIALWRASVKAGLPAESLAGSGYNALGLRRIAQRRSGRSRGRFIAADASTGVLAGTQSPDATTTDEVGQ